MPRTSRSNRLTVAAGVVPVVVGALFLTSCGDDDDGGGDSVEFCDAVEANQDALFNTTLATPADIEAFLELYREVGEHAPLAIESDWNAMTAVFEIAEDYAPDDTTITEQDVLAGAYSSYPSALAVYDWLSENCDVTITVAEMPVPALNTTGTAPPSTG